MPPHKQWIINCLFDFPQSTVRSHMARTDNCWKETARRLSDARTVNLSINDPSKRHVGVNLESVRRPRDIEHTELYDFFLFSFESNI